MTYKPYETYDFQADLSKGKVGEELVKAYLYGENLEVEVKTDFMWKKTGNLYIETECYMQSTGKYEPSAYTKGYGDVWAFVIGKMVLWVPQDCLKKVVDLYGKDAECVNSQNPSRGKLIKPIHLIEMEWRRPS